MTVATVLFTLAAGTPAQAAGRTLYVAPWGTDYNPDGYTTPPNSFDTPWRTMYMTFRRALPGDTIFVRGGIYTEAVGWGAVRATSTNPIRVYNYPGERVVLKGTLQLNKADYWILSGINVTRDPSKPDSQFLVHFGGGTGWQFLNAEVWGTHGVSNVMITGDSTNGIPKNWRLSGDCIHDNLDPGTARMNYHNVYLYPGYTSGPGVIERSLFWGAGNGADIKAAGPSSSTGAAYTTIRYNTFVHSAAAVIVGYGSNHITMVRNLMGAQRGGDSSYNAAMMGNHTTGYGNAASYDGVWGYKLSIHNVNATHGIANGGHIAWLHPVFDSMSSCSGLHPQDAASKAYGRYA